MACCRIMFAGEYRLRVVVDGEEVSNSPLSISVIDHVPTDEVKPLHSNELLCHMWVHMYVVLHPSSAVPQECYLGLELNCSGHGRLRSCLCECDEGWYTDLSSLVGPDTSFVLSYFFVL